MTVQKGFLKITYPTDKSVISGVKKFGSISMSQDYGCHLYAI